MRPREYSAYMILDSRKFDFEDAKKELNRLRALCYRLKTKYDVKFVLGISMVDSSYIWGMHYDKPKNKGGTKQPEFKTLRHHGQSYVPKAYTKPHIHMFIYGVGASSCADEIRDYLKARNPDHKFSKKLHNDPCNGIKYVTDQSTILRSV